MAGQRELMAKRKKEMAELRDFSKKMPASPRKEKKEKEEVSHHHVEGEEEEEEEEEEEDKSTLQLPKGDELYYLEEKMRYKEATLNALILEEESKKASRVRFLKDPNKTNANPNL